MKVARLTPLIPIGLVVLYFLVIAPGIRWGAPDLWHPDELIRKVNSAISGQETFDTENFDYPSLPKYVMAGLSKVVTALGGTMADAIVAARLASVALGAFCVLLAYTITRLLGASPLTAGLAGLWIISISEMALNSRFAHNDLYIAFFTSLTALTLLQYLRSRSKLWLYGAFLCVGLAASSKYNGGSLLLAPLLVYLLTPGKPLKKNPLNVIETLFIGLVLAAAGFAIGTPKSLLWMAYYFKRAAPAIFRHASYGREPGDLVGLLGQWQVLAAALGVLTFLAFLAAILWFAIRLVLFARHKIDEDRQKMSGVLILLGVIFLSDLPIMISYNYPSRFFVPMIPLLACLAALWVEDLFRLGSRSGRAWLSWLAVGLALLAVVLGFLRDAGVMLLFQNDARIPASAYIRTLPAGKTIEYTLYPPTVPEEYFSRKHNYPIFFPKFPGQSLPTSEHYTFNSGETGLEERQTDYLVIDSFTYDRFADQYVCQSLPGECQFFKRLRAGQANYRQIASFRYDLPAFLPNLHLPFVNPQIEVYQRVSTSP
jgi:hypothetical protein